MKFIELKLYTQCLKQELAFYSEVLGFKLTAANHNSFTVKVGWSKLTFEQKKRLLLTTSAF